MTSIAGAGCSLMDYLFTGIDFSGPAFKRFRSRAPGDGGLVPGHLVFIEGLERFTGIPYQDVIAELSGGREPASRNIGGPSVASLVHAAQLLQAVDVPVGFYGVRGDDATGKELAKIVARTPLDWDHYNERVGATPFTHALSDPSWADGVGERSFVNSTGVAADFRVRDIDRSFYYHSIVALGGTALVPALHAEVDVAVGRACKAGALTVINTVYDYLNESRAHDKPWPLGKSDVTYRHTDLLIVDAEEARRLSGRDTAPKAAERFIDTGVSAVIITEGADDLFAVSKGGRFAPLEARRFPISERIRSELRTGAGENGDTIGCGDTFAGGVLYALAEQMRSGERRMDLYDAVTWGVVSGGHTCFYHGGTMIEEAPGEKYTTIYEYVRDYRRQLGAADGSA